MHFAHIDHLVEGLAAAAVVAGVLANAAGGSGQRIVHHHRLECLFEPALLIQLEEAGDIHAQRTTVLAGRQREFLADSGAAAVGDDVVFVLLAEVTHGGQHRDWARTGRVRRANTREPCGPARREGRDDRR